MASHPNIIQSLSRRSVLSLSGGPTSVKTRHQAAKQPQPYRVRGKLCPTFSPPLELWRSTATPHKRARSEG